MQNVCFLVIFSLFGLFQFSIPAYAQTWVITRPNDPRPTVHFMPDSDYKPLEELGGRLKENVKLLPEFNEKFRATFCNGTQPRLSIKKVVPFKPSVDPGTPIDAASQESLKQIAMARYFYQNDFFYISGRGKDLSEYIIRHAKGEKKYNTPGDPQFVTMTDYRLFSRDHSEKTDDIAFLTDGFTFHLPQSVAASLYNSPADDFHVDKLGWGTGQFSASEALNFREYIWRYTFIHDTAVKEAPQADGSITFEVTWTPNLFCQYGVPILDFIAH
jgi:hypothetical protein